MQDPAVKILNIVLGIVRNQHRDVLIARRRQDKHLGELWEFPGGKIEYNETDKDALARELKEEIGIVVSDASFVTQLTHQYDDRIVDLKVFRIESYQGDPYGKEGQAIQWVPAIRLNDFQFPAANQAIIETVLTW